MGFIVGGIALIVFIVGLILGAFVVPFSGADNTVANLFIGVLLVVAGAIVGFIVEWIIDLAYRRNRELQQQLSSGQRVAAQGILPIDEDGNTSEALADFLRQRDQELQELRDKLADHDSQMDVLQSEFDAYQRTHPDDLTVIKGIGPVYQWKLRDAGFNTYKQLASADPDQMRRMLDVKNWQRVNVEAWIAQARDWAQRGE
jgi:predicted flap endonuclease-1-like 5' DNA nuclease